MTLQAADTLEPPEVQSSNAASTLRLEDMPHEITALQAFELMTSGQAPLIDIRSPMEWFQSGIPEGARAISIHEPGFIDALVEVVGDDKNAPFMLICRTGNRSPHVVQALRQHGYSTIYEVPEGLFGSHRSPHPGWVARGLPLKPYNPYLKD